MENEFRQQRGEAQDESLIDIQRMFQFKIHEYLWIDPAGTNFFLSHDLRPKRVCLRKQKKKIIINDEDERLWREMGFREIIMQKSY